jgi:hypothetical protein
LGWCYERLNAKMKDLKVSHTLTRVEWGKLRTKDMDETINGTLHQYRPLIFLLSKERVKENTCSLMMGVGIMRDETLKRRDLNVSHTLGKTYSNLSSGHTGLRSPGQTRKKPKDLTVCDREERGCAEGGDVYVVHVITRSVSMGWVPV